MGARDPAPVQRRWRACASLLLSRVGGGRGGAGTGGSDGGAHRQQRAPAWARLASRGLGEARRGDGACLGGTGARPAPRERFLAPCRKWGGMAWPGWCWAPGKGRTGTAGVGRRSAWTVDATRGKCWRCSYTGGNQGTVFILYGYACSLETKQFLYGSREGRVVLTRAMPPVNKAQVAPRGVMAAHIGQHGERV
ncbi:unnamed protein product [Coccothraustes coccothraustes]